MIDEHCAIEVGTHTKPYWTQGVGGTVICDRHKRQFETAYEDYSDIDWRRATTADLERVTAP